MNSLKDLKLQKKCTKKKVQSAVKLCDPEDEFEMLQRCKICKRIL